MSAMIHAATQHNMDSNKKQAWLNIFIYDI